MPSYASPPCLPVPVSSFVGRDSLVQELTGKLTEPGARPVTLSGPAGIGKTRLAIASAHQVQARFGEGARVVSLAAARDACDVIAHIAGHLGVTDPSADDAIERLQVSLAGRSILLVVDGLPPDPTTAPALERLLGMAPGLTLLVTCRVPVGSACEQVVEVHPLTLPDPADRQSTAGSEAVRLFVTRARETHPGASMGEDALPDIARICARMGGVPLAIELAAARLDVHSVPRLRDQIESRFPASGGWEDRSLQDVVAWSCDQLEPEDVAFIRRLSVFAGGFTLPAVSAVTHLPEDQAIHRLGTLIRHALVASMPVGDGEPRWFMREPVRAHVTRLLASSGDEGDAWNAYVGWFRALAAWSDQALCGERPEHVLAELDRDEADFRRVLDYTLAKGHASDAIALTAMLWRYWRLSGALTEGTEYITRSLAMPEPGDLHLRANACAKLVWFFVLQGDPVRGRAAATEAIELAASVDSQDTLAGAMDLMGTVHMLEGDPDSARPLYERSIAIRKALGNRFEASGGLGNLGMLALHQGDVDEARACLTQAVQMASDIGCAYRWVLYLIDLARVEFAAGDLDTAEALIAQASSYLRNVRDHPDLVLALMVEGQLACAKGDHARGLGHFVECLHLRLRYGMSRNLVDLLERTAIAAARLAPEIAARLMAAVHAWRKEAGVKRLPWDDRVWREARAAVRSALGEQEFSVAWKGGTNLSLLAAGQLALARLKDLHPALGQTSGGADWLLAAGLTRRERDVFNLIAQGMSNQEIADELFLSTGTVKRHVSSTLAKLKLPSRSAAAEAAVREERFATAWRLGASTSMLAACQIALHQVSGRSRGTRKRSTPGCRVPG